MSELAIPGMVPARTVAAAAAGDADALARIVDAHQLDMARLCLLVCGDPEMARDAVQAAWVIAWQRLSSVQEPERLRSWLMSVAANEARQMARRRRRFEVGHIDVAAAGSSHGDPALRTGLADLSVALHGLSTDDRTLLALRYVAGFDATQIGRSLGMSPSGVRSRLSRLLARLRTELTDD